MSSTNRSFAIISFPPHSFLLPSCYRTLLSFPSLSLPRPPLPYLFLPLYFLYTSPPPPTCYLAVPVKVYIQHPNNYRNVFIVLCSFRWSFGVLTWEIVTFGECQTSFSLFIYFFLCHSNVLPKNISLRSAVVDVGKVHGPTLPSSPPDVSPFPALRKYFRHWSGFSRHLFFPPLFSRQCFFFDKQSELC